MANTSSFRVDCDTTPYQEAMARLTASTNQAVNQIKEQFQSVNETFGSMKTLFESAVAVLSGGELAAKLNEIAERAAGMRESAEIFGLSTTALQGLQVIAASTGVESERLQRTMATLEGKMRLAGEVGGQTAREFNALGISTEQLRDPTFTVQDAMEKLGAATNSNAGLLAVLGARGAAIIPMLRELANNHDAVAEAAARVGALTEEETGAMAGYRGQVEITSAAWSNFQTRVASGVVPAMEALLQQVTQFAADTDNAAAAANVFGTAIELVGEEVIAFIGQIKDVAVAIGAIGRIGAQTFAGLGAAISDAASGNYAKAAYDIIGSSQEIKASWTAMWDSFDQNATEAGNRLKALQSAVEAKPLTPPPVPAASSALLPDLSKPTETMEQFLSNAMNKAFDRISEEANAKIAKTFTEITAGIVADAKTQEDAEVGAIDRQIAKVQELGRTHQISASQELTQENTLLAQKWAAQQTYYAKLGTAYSGNQAKLAEINEQEESAWQKHLDDMQKAQDVADRAMAANFQKVADGISSAFSRAIDSMITKDRTFGQTVLSIGSSLVTGLINNFVKMGVAWVEQEILKMIASRTAAQGVVAASAGAAGAAGTASFAAAPWPIDLGAAGFGAAMAATAESFAVAEQGYDIPSGINPQLQAHAREMVLPAELADTVREGVSGGPGGGLHVHLSSHDPKGFRDQLQNSSSDLHRALSSYVKRGGR